MSRGLNLISISINLPNLKVDGRWSVIGGRWSEAGTGGAGGFTGGTCLRYAADSGVFARAVPLHSLHFPVCSIRIRAQMATTRIRGAQC
jgi:hypothetical protein